MAIDLEMAEILKVFFEESAECLNAMESGLLTLQEDADRETIDTIFRAAHSIKGGAGTFGFMPISEFTHSVETMLDEMRSGTRKVGADAVQLLLQAVDVMREMVELAQREQPIVSANASILSEKLAQLLASPNPKAVPGTHPPAAAVETGQGGVDDPSRRRWRIDFKPHPTLLKTCNDPLRILRQLETFGPLTVRAVFDDLPPLADLDPTLCHLAWVIEVSTAATQAQLAEVFEWVDANSSLEYRLLADVNVNVAPASQEAAQLPPMAPTMAGNAAPATLSAPAAPAVTASPTAQPARSGSDAGSMRVATDKVDALINLVGELVITQSMLGRFAEGVQDADLATLRRALGQLSRNTRELQESVLKIRMLPISFSFNRFPRLVHDLSRKLGKKVDLQLQGESTELDKIVLEKIGDPLVHLVRNSLDHGLEIPAVRRAAGKPETGVLGLNAYHEGGNVIIEVRDDGAGLDGERIVAKARERGLVAADAVLSTEQIHNLIFLPGFSTAEAVSDLSGRGVGMDVVRRNIVDLGGHVQITSTRGRGSLIRIRLPLTLAILEGQMLRVGRETYFISLVSIIETVQPRAEHIVTVTGKTELFRHRGAYLPIIRLHDLFGIEPDSRDIASALLVVVESDGRRVAILVDELLAQQQVVIKSLEANFKQVPGIAGATIHGDGTVALILDVPSLIGKFLETAPLPAERAA
jgi:two-component system chemotaxis sensor kinase CheA